jgi:hypothetical protein
MIAKRPLKRFTVLFACQFIAYAQGISGQQLPAVWDSFEGNGTITT